MHPVRCAPRYLRRYVVCRPFEQVKSVHFTLCQKPWSCIHVGDHNHNMDMCRYFHDQWWDVRPIPPPPPDPHMIPSACFVMLR